jgi:tryptophan halogenase
LDEAQFVSAARATLKLGIRHRDWTAIGADYWGPIDNPYLRLPRLAVADVPILEAAFCADGASAVDAYLHTHLMRRCRAPLFGSEEDRFLSRSYAYHFDATLAAAHLELVARSRGVVKIVGHVVRVDRHCSGSVRSLALRDGRQIGGDFFLDCSGFARVLTRNQSQWRSYADVLPTNSAVVAQIPHRAGHLPSYTEAVALSAGWAWLIPTQDRLGAGYVHCDAFQAPDAAADELLGLLGVEDVPIRTLRFASGRLEEPWIGNCAAVGLAAGFLEPLEATSLHMVLLQLALLLDSLTRGAAGDPAEWKRHNEFFAETMDSLRDFVLLHYLGGRVDTPFWRAVAASLCTPRVTMWRDRWKRNFPRRSDVTNATRTISLNLVLPVAAGLGMLDRDRARRALAETTRGLDWGGLRVRHAALLQQMSDEAAEHSLALDVLQSLSPTVATNNSEFM